MKLAITALTALSLTACGGGGNNPFAPVVDDAITVETQTVTETQTATVDPVQPAPAPEPDPVQPVATPTPPPTQDTYLVRAWHCIDNRLGVVNDTWVDARLVEMYSDGTVVDPDLLYVRWDEGSNYINLYDWQWNSSGLSRVADSYFANEFSACSDTLPSVTIEQQMPEPPVTISPMVGVWQCTAYVPNGYNYTKDVNGPESFDDTWTLSDDGRIATTSQSNAQAGYHQCLYMSDGIDPVLTAIESQASSIVKQPDWTTYECSQHGTIYLDNSNSIYSSGGTKIGDWSSTPEYLEMTINNSPEQFSYSGEDLFSQENLCTYVEGPTRTW